MIAILFHIAFAAFAQSHETTEATTPSVDEHRIDRCKAIEQVISLVNWQGAPKASEYAKKWIELTQELSPTGWKLVHLHEELLQRAKSGKSIDSKQATRESKRTRRLITAYERRLPNKEIQAAVRVAELQHLIPISTEIDQKIGGLIVTVREHESALTEAGVEFTPFNPANPQSCPAN